MPKLNQTHFKNRVYASSGGGKNLKVEIQSSLFQNSMFYPIKSKMMSKQVTQGNLQITMFGRFNSTTITIYQLLDCCPGFLCIFLPEPVVWLC